MPPFREVVFVTTRPRRLGHLRKLLRAVRVTSHVRLMDPRQWCDTPEARCERLVFVDAASAPSREALIAARRGAFGSRLVLCCRTPVPEIAQTAMECGLDGVLSANLAPEDAARALRQICLGERQFRFEAPPARRAPAVPFTADRISRTASAPQAAFAAGTATGRTRPTVSFSAERIAPAASPAQGATLPASGTPRNTPAVSFAAERLALTASSPRTAPPAPSAAKPDFDTLWMFGASES